MSGKAKSDAIFNLNLAMINYHDQPTPEKYGIVEMRKKQLEEVMESE